MASPGQDEMERDPARGIVIGAITGAIIGTRVDPLFGGVIGAIVGAIFGMRSRDIIVFIANLGDALFATPSPDEHGKTPIVSNFIIVSIGLVAAVGAILGYFGNGIVGAIGGAFAGSLAGGLISGLIAGWVAIYRIFFEFKFDNDGDSEDEPPEIL